MSCNTHGTWGWTPSCSGDTRLLRHLARVCPVEHISPGVATVSQLLKLRKKALKSGYFSRAPETADWIQARRRAEASMVADAKTQGWQELGEALIGLEESPSDL